MRRVKKLSGWKVVKNQNNRPRLEVCSDILLECVEDDFENENI